MKIQNLDCKYLRILSSNYEKNYYLDNLKSVQIRASVNGGDFITENINIDELTYAWQVSFSFDAYTRITQIYLKNVFTRQLYPLLATDASYPVTVPGLNVVKSVIASAILTKFGLTVTPSYTISGSTVTFSVTGLPAYLTTNRIHVTVSLAATLNKYFFTYQNSDNYILGGDDIILRPSFFGSTTDLVDGIYTVRTTVLDKQNIYNEEETCFFVDCTIGQSLVAAIDIDACETLDISMLMMHYGLKVASNKHCDCSNMLEIFNYLQEQLGSSNSDPCGC